MFLSEEAPRFASLSSQLMQDKGFIAQRKMRPLEKARCQPIWARQLLLLKVSSASLAEKRTGVGVGMVHRARRLPVVEKYKNCRPN
jgi:hypothetical protein